MGQCFMTKIRMSVTALTLLSLFTSPFLFAVASHGSTISKLACRYWPSVPTMHRPSKLCDRGLVSRLCCGECLHAATHQLIHRACQKTLNSCQSPLPHSLHFLMEISERCECSQNMGNPFRLHHSCAYDGWSVGACPPCDPMVAANIVPSNHPQSQDAEQMHQGEHLSFAVLPIS